MTTRLVLYSEFFNIFVKKLRIMLTTKRKCDKQKKKIEGGIKYSGSLNFFG